MSIDDEPTADSRIADTLGARIASPSAAAREEALVRLDALAKPLGALGRLETLAAWVASVQGTCPPHPFARPVVVVLAGDHGVARTAGTSAYPPEVTAQMVLAFARGGAAVNVLARQTSARVRVVDVAVDADPAYADAVAPSISAHRIRRGSGSIDREDAMSLDEAVAAFELGQRIADEEIDAGADLIVPGDMGIGNTTAAAALVGVLTNANAADVTGNGTGIDDATWMRKTAAVRDAMRRGKPVLADQIRLLATIGGADIAAMSGLIAQASARGVPVLLDGVVSCAAALVVDRMSHRARLWWMAGHRSTEPAQHRALERLDLEPIVDYAMRLGEGTGALIALPVLQSAAALLAEMELLADLSDGS